MITIIVDTERSRRGRAQSPAGHDAIFMKQFKLLHPSRPSAKIFLPFFRISANHKHIPRPQEGRFAIVTSVGAGRSGRDHIVRRAMWSRTAKSCGPGPPTLGSSLRDDDHAGDGG